MAPRDPTPLFTADWTVNRAPGLQADTPAFEVAWWEN